MKKITNDKTILFAVILFIVSLFMSVGYAAINSVSLNVTGTATATKQNGVFITDVVYTSNVSANVAESKINDFYGTLLNSTVSLSTTNSNSSITYTVTVYNSYDVDYEFKGVVYDSAFYDNEDITYSLSGINVGDVIGSHQSKTFTITFSYENGVGQSNILNSYLNFDFAEPGSYAITYNLEGGSFDSTPVSSFNVHTPTFDLPTPTKEGYVFDGWTDGTMQYQEAGNISTTMEPNRTYNAATQNGKIIYIRTTSGEAFANYVEYSSTQTRLMVFTYDENAVVQWSNNASSWTTINNWVTTTVNSETVYYQYFTFNSSGINHDSGIEDYGGTYTDLLSDLGSDVLIVYNPYTVQNGTDHDITVTANWRTPTQVTVTFNNNGGSGTMNSQTFMEGTSQAINQNTFTRNNYTFAGWSTSPNGTVEYTDQEVVSIVGNKTLYAVWEPNVTYTVTFNNNGGTGTMDNQTLVGGESQNLNANTFTNTGYVFKGWATSAGGSVVYTDGQAITGTSDLELFAVWGEPQTYTVTFNRNRGTGTMDSQTFTEGVEQALTTNTFTRRRYTFSGWATSAYGPVVYTDGQTITVTEDMTLYAVWTR